MAKASKPSTGHASPNGSGSRHQLVVIFSAEAAELVSVVEPWVSPFNWLMVVDYELAGTSCHRFLMAAPCRACIGSAHFLDGCALSGLHSLRSCGFLRAQTTFVCLGEKPDLFRNNLCGPRNELDSEESRFD